MSKVLQVTLGILTAIGGMIDIGNIVGNTEAGARFGMGLAWVLVLGGIAMVLYANMAGRVAAISHRATFDVVRERLGPRVALLNLVASFALTLLTLVAEVGGVGLVLEVTTGVDYRAFVVPTVLAIGWILWRVKFESMERFYGLLGLALLVLFVAVWSLHLHGGRLTHQATHPIIPAGESFTSYAYLAVAQFGAMATPYQIFFFTSGAVEERWSSRDLGLERANVFIGFTLGTLLALALMVLGATVLMPRGILVHHLSQVGLPVTLGLGRAGLLFLLIGMFAAVFGAAAEACLSSAYCVCQFFGWQWGKFVQRKDAPRFYTLWMLALVVALFGAIRFDPIKVTEISLVLSAAALPLTFFPTLVVANDPAYCGDKTNARAVNIIASAILVFMVVVSLAAVPLIIVTRGNA
jgi:Mn2+/Fe2+ NRAMP family transporter